MEKMLFVKTSNCSNESEAIKSVQTVNDYLDAGWRIKMISSQGVPDECDGYTTAYVVLEKED